MSLNISDVYSIIIAVHPDTETEQGQVDWRLGDITVDWVDFTREKSTDRKERERTERYDDNYRDDAEDGSQPERNIPGAMTTKPKPKPSKPRKRERGPKRPESPDSLSLQALLAHIPGPNPVTVDTSSASGVTQVGRGVVHLFKHAPPAGLVARLDGQNGESSRVPKDEDGWAGERAEGEDGSLIAILAVPAWMRPADLLEFLGGWVTCLEGVRMIREATTPNRSIVLLKFRDPLQANDFMVIFTGRAFSTLDARETCHTIRIHHLVLHKLEDGKNGDVTIPIPAFPPSVYASRARELPELLKGVDATKRSELPSCPVCLERLDSTVTGLVTLPCAHTFDCDCLRKWGDSRCPVCRVSHLLLQSAQGTKPVDSQQRDEITRLTRCGMCDNTEDNWICVVCGVVGCGRYSKGHARRHWKESGHMLAMELETQRVWDYNGDNYVHRLIQTRTDGKLVELPSASSLVTATTPSRPLPLNRSLDSPGTPGGSPTPPADRNDSHAGHAGPSSGDMEKMSTIEAITLEYSYLLSSQLEAMRQHYESESSSQAARIAQLEADNARVRAAEAAAASSEAARREAELAKQKAEARAAKALEITRSLQGSLGSEKSMTEGLTARIAKLRSDLDACRAARDERTAEVKTLEETVRDLMFTLEAGMKIQESGGAEGGEGGDLVVVGGKKKKKK